MKQNYQNLKSDNIESELIGAIRTLDYLYLTNKKEYIYLIFPHIDEFVLDYYFEKLGVDL